MPDNEPATNATETEGQTSQVSGAVPTTTTTSSEAETEARNIRSADKWRYPDDYPVTWLRGRTADEAGQLFNQMYGQSMTASYQQPQQAPPQPQQTYGGQNQYPQQPQQPQDPTDEDWLNDPRNATTRYVTGLYEKQLNPQLQQMYQMNAQMARETIRQAEHEMFDSYGPEIDQLIGQMAIEQRTPDNIRLAVQVVRGRHVDEIADKRARAKLEQMQEQFGMRADGGVTPSPTGVSARDGVDFDISKLPENYQTILRKNNVTADTLRTFLQQTECNPRGITLKQAFDEWMEAATKGDYVMPGEVFRG